MLKFTKSNNKKKSSGKLEWYEAPDIKKRVNKLITSLELDHIKEDRVFCFRSENSKTKAYARIWGLSRIFQMALDVKPAYILEVISEKFDGLSQVQKDEILLHELTHIPSTFSGSLMPHYRKGKRNFDDKVKKLIAKHKETL